MIACGLGRNSVAMIIMMFARGQFMPIVFCDTGSEMPETYEYIPYFNAWLKKTYNRSMVILSAKETPELYSEDTRRDLFSYYLSKRAIPLLMNKACTDKFKIRPMNKWMKKNNITEKYLGIDAGEAHRADGQNLDFFPLVKEGIDLAGCIDIIKGAGLDAPVKSGCYLCPNQKQKGFRALKRNHPGLFEKAMLLDETSINRRRAEGKVFSPLLDPGPALADLDKEIDMFPDYDFSDEVPCMCTL